MLTAFIGGGLLGLTAGVAWHVCRCWAWEDEMKALREQVRRWAYAQGYEQAVKDEEKLEETRKKARTWTARMNCLVLMAGMTPGESWVLLGAALLGSWALLGALMVAMRRN